MQLNWRIVVEAFGLAAIVGSLIFVGMQLRQDQAIALAEIGQSTVESYISIDALIVEHADILAKANSGEQLSDSGTLIINRIAHSLHLKNRLEANMRKSMGQEGTVPARLLAIFLLDNPGVHRAWLTLSEEEEKQYSLLERDATYITGFRADVLNALNKLEGSADQRATTE